jgi:hypothetical protein
VVTRPGSAPGTEGVGDARAGGDDAEWLRSFLRTQPGKTHRIDATDDAHEEAARESLAVAARILTDEAVRGSEVRGSEVAGTDHTKAPGQPA